tara:strand:- start:144 stop:410 length:267 start_codon:yes stop_codon:yes gene_type:complete
MVKADGKTYNVGQALYESLPHFANANIFLDKYSQTIIAKYNYCKSSKTPPYATIDKTPANFIDDFMVIEQELKQIQREQQKKANENGS